MQASNIVRNIFWKDARDSFRGCFLLVSSVTDITADYFTEKNSCVGKVKPILKRF